VFGLPPPLGSNFNKTEAQCQQPDDVQKSHAPTWLVDFDYKPTQDILLYAKYSRGYRQGSAFPFTYGFEKFGPEKLEAYEIGSKTSFHGAGAIRGTFNMAAFFNDFTNQQLLVASIAAPTNPNQTSGNFVANAGKSRIAGVELDTSITLFEGFQLEGAYTYLDTKLKSINLPQPTALWSSFESTSLAGQPLTLSPKNRYTITAMYTLPFKRLGAISLGATFAHSDEQFSTFADTPYIAKTGRDLGLLPAQNLLNLNLNWDEIAGKPVDLSLFATNVTNRAFPVNVYGGYGSLGFEGTAQNQPRMYGGRVRWRFAN
jgi:iron complex outermembrane receptor protein